MRIMLTVLLAAAATATAQTEPAPAWSVDYRAAGRNLNSV